MKTYFILLDKFDPLKQSSVSGIQKLINQKKAYYCSVCKKLKANEKDKCLRNGVFTHHFINPSNNHFHIVTLSSVHDISLHGAATDECTWFAGFSWQFCYCLTCETHLGWYFESSKNQFFGLILNLLNFK